MSDIRVSMEQSPQDKRKASVALGFLLAIYLVASIDRAILGILVQPIKEELLLADWQLGFLTGFAFTVVYVGFGIPMARMSDKGQRVTLLAICVSFWSIMTALCGMAGNFVHLLLARMGVGVGESACLPASHSLLSDYYPPLKRTKALATFGLGLPLGSLLGTLIGGFVVDHWGWRAAFHVVGLPGLLLALIAWRVVKEPPRGRFDAQRIEEAVHAEPKSFKEVALMMWRSPVLRHMIIALTLTAIATSPTAGFLGAYLVRRFPISYTELGMIVALTSMLGSTLSTYFGGVITQRLAQRDQTWLLRFPAVTMALGAPFAMLGLAQSTWQALGLLLFLGNLINTTFLAPCYTVSHNTLPPGGRAKGVVILTIFISLIGHSTGPLLAGAANDVIAAMQFGNLAPGGFAVACPGGQGAPGAAAAIDAACRESMADATQWVMIAFQGLAFWSAWHFYLASRAMKRSAGSRGTVVPA